MWRGSRAGRARARAGGFTYIGLLALIVLIGFMLAAAGEVASTAAQRERELQLLWTGHEYRAAIGQYWRQKRIFPQTLKELLGEATNGPAPVRYLRQLYPDPMTNALDWELVPAPNGGIMGIASSSKRAPLKTAHFDDADMGFTEAIAYSDWQFTFVTALAARRRNPPYAGPSRPIRPAAVKSPAMPHRPGPEPGSGRRPSGSGRALDARAWRNAIANARLGEGVNALAGRPFAWASRGTRGQGRGRGSLRAAKAGRRAIRDGPHTLSSGSAVVGTRSAIALP